MHFYTSEIKADEPCLLKDSFRLTKRTPIISLGSCFANRIGSWLLQNGYNYLIKEATPGQGQGQSAYWGTVFSVDCMRQILEYSLDGDISIEPRWWPPKEGSIGQFRCPFRRINAYTTLEEAQTDWRVHCKASFEAISEAEIVILTLGLTETWMDIQTDKHFAWAVPRAIANPDRYKLRVASAQEVFENLETILILLSRFSGPHKRIILSVSPVPLHASFREDVSAMVANNSSKAKLRVAAEQDVSYFESYEIATSYLAAKYYPFTEDHRHVKDETVEEIMKFFQRKYT